MAFPKLVTGRQMAEIDRQSIEIHGIAGAVLMERAGARVVETLQARWARLDGLQVAVVCGKGNNGGDGFVVGRRLHESGATVEVYLEAHPDEVSGDALALLDKLRTAGVVPQRLPADDGGALAALRQADLVIDALLGTGLRGPARGPAARAIALLTAAERPVVAVDLPSGVEADSGGVSGPCVQAEVTVTFGLAKVGHLFHPGRAHCGTLELVDIGFPSAALDACEATSFLLTAEGVSSLVPRRVPTAHKGTCGSVAVLAGSVGMTGAAALTAAAALRGGAGRVTLGTPASLNDILETKVTEVMTRPLPEVRRSRCLSLRALGAAAELAGSAQAVALGPGLGRHRETTEFVRRLLARPGLPPVVLDADGLNALAGQPERLEGSAAPLVVTPHPGEFEALSGVTPSRLRQDPLGPPAAFAERYGLVVVLKGAPTVVAAPDGRTFVNPTGNAGMATAGAGDVLTGLVAALLAQGAAPLEAALAGVYLHGLAGDRAAAALGQWSLCAGDLLEHLPGAFGEVVSGNLAPSAGHLDTRAALE